VNRMSGGIYAAILLVAGTALAAGPTTHTRTLNIAGIGAPLVSPDPNVRIVLISAFLAYVRVSIAWMAFRLRPVHRPKYSYYFLSISSCAEAGMSGR